jgi:DNA/RNA endonuclease YhcR with UshA esterase domain
MRALAVVLALAQTTIFAFAQQVISPNETKDHVGQIMTVEGVASEVHHAASGKVTFIDIGGRYPDNAFAGVIFSNDASKFPDVDSFSGKTIDITGRVKLYRGAAEIILNDQTQIRVK